MHLQIRRTFTLFFTSAFLFQLYNIIHESVYPSGTVTNMEEKSTAYDRVVFQICPEPAFHQTALQELGYDSTYDYFLGRSRFNSSIYGWSGHTKNNTIISNPEDVYFRVAIFPRPENLFAW